MQSETGTIERLKSWQIREVIELLQVHAATRASFGQLLRYCLEKHANAFVAIQDQKIIGIVAGHLSENEVAVDILCVHKDYRRRRWARKLIDRLIQAYGENKTYTLDVRPSNHVARSVYQNWGFTTSGTKPAYYYNEDALTMVLPHMIQPVNVNPPLV